MTIPLERLHYPQWKRPGNKTPFFLPIWDLQIFVPGEEAPTPPTAPNMEWGARLKEPHPGAPQVTFLHTPSPRRHMSRSVGTQMMLSKPLSALVPIANRSRWRRYVGLLRPYAVIQSWGKVGEAAEGCCRQPQERCASGTC